MKNNKSPAYVSGQRIGLMLLCAFLAIVFVVMLFLTITVQDLLNPITINGNGTSIDDDYHTGPFIDPDAQFTAPTIDATDPRVTAPTLPSNPNLAVEGVVNILLIGDDRRPGEPRQRSDSMILCSFNKNSNSLTMISFLRDTYVSIPGYRYDKLNAAYAQKNGLALLNQTLASNFGVHVDANIMIDFEGFRAVVDMLGGVDIELTQKEANYLNKNNGWSLRAGMQHLDGAKALAYSRIRKIDMDAMRAQRQRKVLTAIMNNYKNRNAYEMVTLASQILKAGYIKTDMTASELSGYILTLFPMLATANVNNQQIPAAGTYEDMSVGSLGDCKVIDFDINRKILQNILGSD
ncbi:MAG: LytR family transcriptional regulator [Ruminococcaceae bacterium]|nr:LytR family transcriptional regulator [Oscillospiraceae bacterium]